MSVNQLHVSGIPMRAVALNTASRVVYMPTRHDYRTYAALRKAGWQQGTWKTYKGVAVSGWRPAITL